MLSSCASALRSLPALVSRATMSSTRTAARPLSPSTPDSPDSATTAPHNKRQKRDHDIALVESAPVKTPRKRTLPYERGMHLAPMVRIGTLPVRLVALDYGAELVWGPEIVDKAIIGAERKVDPRTGVVSFCKNGRSIFDCHPLEKPRLIFQLGSASPELAVQAIKVIENDVAGVGLNCGCPKSFSLSGGMGAALLKEPEKLCSILTAMVNATDLPVDAKIRLLPLPPKGADSPSAVSSTLATPAATPPLPLAEAAQPTPSAVLEPTVPPTLTVPSEPPQSAGASEVAAPASSSAAVELGAPTLAGEDDEPTHALVERIFSTGIANLTVHCRTQEMRSREPALHERMRGITRMGHERGIPVVCNGDAVGGGKEAGWGNFDEVCEKTGVSSVMIARAAEANPSCFAKSGLSDPITEVIPRLIRAAIATNNHYSNTKYILNAMYLFSSPTPPSRETNRDIKQKMNKAKTYEEMAAAFGIDAEEVKQLREEANVKRIEELVPRWTARRDEIVAQEGEI